MPILVPGETITQEVNKIDIIPKKTVLSFIGYIYTTIHYYKKVINYRTIRRDKSSNEVSRTCQSINEKSSSVMEELTKPNK